MTDQRTLANDGKRSNFSAVGDAAAVVAAIATTVQVAPAAAALLRPNTDAKHRGDAPKK